MNKITIYVLLACLWTVSAVQAQSFGSPAMRKLQMAEFAISNFYVDKVDEDKLVEEAIIKMLAQLDPHSTYSDAEEVKKMNEIKLLPWWKSVLYIIGGLAALIYGGQLFVNGATGIARNLGVSESIIGLTLVAGGTSLPELATSIVAALKKNPEIAIGNVIGSNLFNIFFVLGCSASITPLHLSGITNFDLLTLVGSCILLWLFGLFFAKRTITRIEGSIMILCYVAYTVVLIYNT